jgi:hypothetical protein
MSSTDVVEIGFLSFGGGYFLALELAEIKVFELCQSKYADSPAMLKILAFLLSEKHTFTTSREKHNQCRGLTYIGEHAGSETLQQSASSAMIKSSGNLDQATVGTDGNYRADELEDRLVTQRRNIIRFPFARAGMSVLFILGTVYINLAVANKAVEKSGLYTLPAIGEPIDFVMEDQGIASKVIGMLELAFVTPIVSAVKYLKGGLYDALEIHEGLENFKACVLEREKDIMVDGKIDRALFTNYFVTASGRGESKLNGDDYILAKNCFGADRLQGVVQTLQEEKLENFCDRLRMERGHAKTKHVMNKALLYSLIDTPAGFVGFWTDTFSKLGSILFRTAGTAATLAVTNALMAKLIAAICTGGPLNYGLIGDMAASFWGIGLLSLFPTSISSVMDLANNGAKSSGHYDLEQSVNALTTGFIVCSMTMLQKAWLKPDPNRNRALDYFDWSMLFYTLAVTATRTIMVVHIDALVNTGHVPLSSLTNNADSLEGVEMLFLSLSTSAAFRSLMGYSNTGGFLYYQMMGSLVMGPWGLYKQGSNGPIHPLGNILTPLVALGGRRVLFPIASGFINKVFGRNSNSG